MAHLTVFAVFKYTLAALAAYYLTAFLLALGFLGFVMAVALLAK